MVQLNHSTNEHPADTAPSFAPLAEGDYTMMITESKLREDKNGNKMLSVTFQPTQAAHPALFQRRVWEDYRLGQKTGKAEMTIKIARAKLSKLVEACGMESISNTEQLHLTPMTVTIYHDTYDGKTTAKVADVAYLDSGRPQTEYPEDKAIPF